MTIKPQSKIIQLTTPKDGNGVWAEHCLALCQDGSIWRFMPDNEPERQWKLLFEMKYKEPYNKPGWQRPKFEPEDY